MLLSTSLALISTLQLGRVAASPFSPRATAVANTTAVNTTTCNGQTYVYEELAGFGWLASDARDKFGDTIGGIGSSIALEKGSWRLTGGKHEAYTGIVWGLPDRGWNTQDATLAKPASPNVQLKYLDTVLLYGPDGTPTTGLDADAKGFASFKGFPDLPVATYTGDGFGNAGPGGKRISIDAEGLVLGNDGSFWISDEYGPYVYQFNSRGKLVQAIRPPDALIPIRNGTESFSANSPPIYNQNYTVKPGDPTTGRQNNQGLEGLTASPDGKYLFALLQSATEQEGGAKSSTRRNTRLLKYSLGWGNSVNYEAEYIVQLPVLSTGKIAAQSEIHFISDSQLLVLARDSNSGHGQSSSTSIYRNADVIDFSKATNIKGKYDAFNGSAASSAGVLNADVTPVTYCPWLSYNNNDQLNRFGAHNGGSQNQTLLNEKWESLALAPVDDKYCHRKSDGQEYYLLSFSDNDFITQNGYINFGKQKYVDSSGYNVDNQILIFKVRLPKGANPL